MLLIIGKKRSSNFTEIPHDKPASLGVFIIETLYPPLFKVFARYNVSFLERNAAKQKLIKNLPFLHKNPPFTLYCKYK